MKSTPSSNFLGTLSPKASFIIDEIRKELRGTLFTLRVRGRNSDRKQFYHLYANRARILRNEKGKIIYNSQRYGIQQDLPLEHATSLALYLRPRNYNVISWEVLNDLTNAAKIRVDKVIRKHVMMVK